MSSLRHRPFRSVPVLCLLILAAAPVAAAKEGTLPVDSWLVLGPVNTPWPAFHDSEDHGVDAAELLAVAGLTGGAPWPEAGAEVTLPSGERAAWKTASAPDGALALGEMGRSAETPRLAWMAVRIDAARFAEPKLTVRSGHPVRAWVDGVQVGQKGSDPGNGPIEDEDPEDGERGEVGARGGGADEASAHDAEGADDGTDAGPGTTAATLSLKPGPHLLVIQAAFDPAGPDGGPEGWSIAAELATGEGEDDLLELAADPVRRISVADYLDVASVEDLAVSADGELAALTFARPAVPAEDRESWTEIVRGADGTPTHTFRGGSARSSFAWGPDGHRYVFTTSDGDRSTVWVGDLDAGRSVPLLRDVENLGGVHWSPTGSFLVYTVSEKEEGDDSGFKRLRALEDRWRGWRDRGYLYQVRVPERLDGISASDPPPVARRLTAGDRTTSLVDIAPDGSRLLFTRTERITERPYSAEHLFELDLGTLETRHLERLSWFGGASYGPDGGRVLVAGGPSTFGEVGLAVPEGVVANDYDTQAYLYDLEGGDVRSLTEAFDPAILDGAWSPDGESVLFRVADGPSVRIVRHDLAPGSFERIETGLDAVAAMDLSRDGSRLVYQGSSADAPARVMSLAVGGGGTGDEEPVTLFRTAPERYGQLRLGRVEDFSFTASSGTEIAGRVHYPPGFDPRSAPAASAPAIVYYYGGTVPVERSFGGRYPFNLWAAHGYVVYVLQPSGAIGFGQELSSRHVNDWGKVVAGEIIEGTEAFLESHPAVDPERVGCGGASYGGFMTMYLLTETDLFRAAVAHAGISSLASYWGEGWWGYLYSAVASAESFPWNREDLYVEQSPLFLADRITTPLLLLHGTADTNVPVGESRQLFTALTLLEREVEMIEIEGSNHQIFQYPKRERWMETLIAWYDRELKDQPGWWENLYPEEGGP